METKSRKMKFTDLKDMLNQTGEVYGDRPAYIFKTEEKGKFRTITHKEFRENINALGTTLIQMGLKDKRIALISENRYEWELSYLAVASGVGVIVPLDKALPDNELESLILRSQVEAIIYSSKYDVIMNTLREKKNTNLKYFISMDLEENTQGIYAEKALVEKGKKLLTDGNKTYIDAKIDSEKMGIMLFTSGTTAMSKAVMLSHKNLVTNVMDIIQRFDLTDEDRFLSFLPLHHVFECTVGFLYPISIGGSIAFCEGVKHMAENIKEFEITAMISVPAVFDIIYRKVMKTIEKKGKLANLEKGKKVSQFLLKMKIDLRKQLFKEVHESLGPKLKLVVTGGAALDPETEKGFNDLGFDVEQGYGLTETAPVIAAETPKCRRLGSIGKKFPSVEVKIDDPDEEGIGELMAKGPSIMLGYYENEEATKSALESDGWFHTGDLARIDKDGYIYISGRKKSVIVLNNGKNVFPEEIETLLNKVEGIKETFVFEKKEDDGDVKVCVEIVYDKELIKELYNIEGEENIKEFLWDKVKEVNKLMPKYKYVREMVITEEPLIKTTTLKIKRHEELKKVLGK
ncbi:MAG: AMP-binding protein [Clostridium sp.]|jgi:long-chain acyl-CoA synthetase|nr:AMP-binding protein [Clostridium sp.]CDE54633.1 aMP-dependent synthetase and ligase [Clostridium sp. CAG:269]